MRKILHITATLIAAAGLALPAAAQTGPDTKSGDKRPYPEFKKVDKNGDGKITWEEAKSAGIPKDAFESADYDEDGELTRVGYRFSLNQTG